MVAQASRSTQRPSVGDQRRFLGQRHELGGGDVAEQRVPPAQQRLDRDGAVHDDVDHGLEDQPQLAAVERAVEVGAQGVAAVLLDAQGVVVAVHGARAGGAGAAQGEVAAAQRLTGVDVGQQGGDAGDGGQVQGAAGDRRAGRRRRPGGRPRSRRRRCCRRRGRRSRRPCRGPASPRRAGRG